MPLKICTFNAQGLSTKFTQFMDFMYENEPDIIVIAETFFDNTIDNKDWLYLGMFPSERTVNYTSIQRAPTRWRQEGVY